MGKGSLYIQKAALALVSVYSTPSHMLDTSDIICCTYMHVHPLYSCQKFRIQGIYDQFGRHLLLANNNVRYFLQLVVFCLVFANMSGLYAHRACWLCDLSLQCDSHIYSVLYVKYVYSAPFHMVDGSDFICAYICHTCPSKVWHIWPVYGAYLFLAHMAITCELDVAVGCIFSYI